MTSTLLQADTIVTLDAQDQIFEPGYIALEDGRITAIGQDTNIKSSYDEVVDLGESLLMPGLVNTHTHTPMVLFRGLAEGVSLFSMEGFLEVLRVLEGAADESMVAAAVEVSCAEMIRTGTTCFADQYFYMDEILPVVQKSGLRAALAYGIVELGDEASRERELAGATRLLERAKDGPLIKGWVGPHAFFVDNSLEAIQLELDLAEKYQTGFHIHLATNWEEENYCQENYGISAVEQMKKIGVLDYPLLAAHCITIPEEDFPTLAAAPFTAVICPSAAMRSATGSSPLKALQAAGVNTALGSDNVANANSYDMFNEMQLAAKLMSYREQEPAAIPARDILDMATMGGARALGLEDEIGSLEVGKQADIIALDQTSIGWGPRGAQDIFTALVYGISGMHVTDVMVAGNWLLRDTQWTTVNYPAARETMNEDYKELRRRLDA
ncbi:MAG: amidohydrolase [Chloroflexi bacterium]|nr:MAG: amidohydrolase [Chloroflexota bacterium]MBL1194704.1 amidohydrolase [Chloroflexota bacterium]NOH11997.1 amidohydrolase [Chloroflexota bacterium]